MKWDNLSAVLEDYCQNILQVAKERMPEYYALKNYIRFDLVIDGTTFIVTFNGPAYSQWAIDGRGPGKRPPIPIIDAWVKKRFGTPSSFVRRPVPVATKSRSVPAPVSPGARKGSIPSSSSPSSSGIHPLTYPIANKIAREGTAGHPFLKDSVDALREEYERRIVDAITADIVAELDTFLTVPFNVA